MEKRLLVHILGSPRFHLEFYVKGTLAVVEDVLLMRCLDFTMGREPSPFLCALARLVTLAPEAALLRELIGCADYKYATALACVIIRLSWSPIEVHKALTPLYGDWRRIRVRMTREGGERIVPLDMLVELLLKPSPIIGDLKFPLLPLRSVYESQKLLPRLRDVLEELLTNQPTLKCPT
ncbi:putative PRP38 family protein [Giardia muris]|uniref:Pre-mRNA-splicing factor 38 n=1 Tax=Giardia muris TaxID=5742 RepID=A0A4Z1STZ5_GIAMU|nr:putative PRP38 family protein [Giardia muris]|eukprot:TNJ27098.1 putative PRP38 family protein [Giardia muris]